MTPKDRSSHHRPVENAAARPPSPLPKPSGTRRQRRWVALLALAVVIGGALGAWLFFQPSKPPPPPIPAGIADAEVVRAIAGARQKVVEEPKSAEAWGKLGMTFATHQFEPEGDRCFSEAERLDEADSRWPYYRGLLSLRANTPEAEPYLRKAVALNHRDPEYASAARLRLAELLVELQKVDEAEEMLREELLREPRNPRANLRLGLMLLARGEAMAASHLTAAAASPRARKKATAALAISARALGDNATAARLEKEVSATATDEDWADPYIAEIARLRVGLSSRLKNADELEKEGRYAEAIQLLLPSIREPPTASLCIKVGSCFLQLEDYQRASELFEQARQLEPNDDHAHFYLALGAISEAEDLSQRVPESPRIRERFRETVVHAKRATELNPSNARAYLFWGQALVNLGEPAEAVAPLRKAIECRPEAVESHLALGEALLRLKRYDEAGMALKSARQLAPEDPRVISALERLRRK